MQKLRHCVLAKVGALVYDWGHHATYLTSFFYLQTTILVSNSSFYQNASDTNFREDLQAS